jgi:EpsD family peptidyl-prolyl cis-trans isomerase
VIAKVNDDEISIHQVNFVLSRTNGINQDNVEIAKKQIGIALVDQSLLNQKAIADKKGRDPEILMSIEQAKRQVLARTWLDKTTRDANKPTVQKIEQYYQAYPALFAKHKTYKLNEVLIDKADDKQNLINQYPSASKQVDELLTKLVADKIAFQVNLTTEPAENLPLDQLPALQGLKEGQFISINKDNGTLVLSFQIGEGTITGANAVVLDATLAMAVQICSPTAQQTSRFCQA